MQYKNIRENKKLKKNVYICETEKSIFAFQVIYCKSLIHKQQKTVYYCISYKPWKCQSSSWNDSNKSLKSKKNMTLHILINKHFDNNGDK